jgi:SAM-dependent methyltransferase
LPPAGAALDVGAGRGIASFALAREGFAVSALEPDDSDLVGAAAIRSLASEAGLAITVVQDFSESLPFPDASFDVVFARAVLHHTRDLAAACQEFARVLRPGGRVLAIREHVISRPDDKQAFLEAHPLHRLYGGENAFLLSEYVAALEQAGLRLQKVLDPFESPINFAPYTLTGLQAEIAQRADRILPGAGGAVSRVFAVPFTWRVARRILSAFDHRPGRLYSFLAEKAVA